MKEIFLFDSVILIRLCAALLFGFFLGFEREITGKFAGLRTHILVCAGAAIFTILSIYGFQYHLADGTVGTNDPARIAAQVITGIGFIGAGTIMRHGTNISGITTAATLWVAAAVGMACGCGMIFLGFISTFLTLMVLVSIRHFEKKFILHRIANPKLFDISFTCLIGDFDFLNNLIQENFKFVEKFKKKLKADGQLLIKFTVSSKKPLSRINEIFKNIPNIDSLEISEIHE